MVVWYLGVSLCLLVMSCWGIVKLVLGFFGKGIVLLKKKLLKGGILCGNFIKWVILIIGFGCWNMEMVEDGLLIFYLGLRL